MNSTRPPPPAAKWLSVKQGISQVELASRIGKSPTWVCLVLNGHEPAPESFKIAVAAILGLPVEECFRPEGEPRPSCDDERQARKNGR